MRTRTKARQRAVEALFEADQRGVPVDDVFDRNLQVNSYAVELAKLTQDNLIRIDELINTYSTEWPVERMPAVDRSIIRMAIAELLYEKQLDTNVIVSEAIEITKTLSTEESVKFINGLLSNVANVRATLTTW